MDKYEILALVVIAVYVVADVVPKGKQVEGEFASIYHYLLFVDGRGRL